MILSLAEPAAGWLLNHNNGRMWVSNKFLMWGLPLDFCWRLTAASASIQAILVDAQAVAAASPPAPLFTFACNPSFAACPAAQEDTNFLPCKPEGTSLRPGYQCSSGYAACPAGRKAIACNCVSKADRWQ